MKKQTMLQVSEQQLDGYVFVQWRMQLLTDAGVLVSDTPYSITLAPEFYTSDGVLIPATDRTAALNKVNADFGRAGFPPVSSLDDTTIIASDTTRTAVVAALPIGVSSVL